MDILTAQQCSSTKGDIDYSLDPNQYEVSKIRNLIMDGSEADIVYCIDRLNQENSINLFWSAAVSLGNLGVVQQLVESKNFFPTPVQLSQAVSEQEYSILSYIFDCGFDINSKKSYLFYCSYFHKDQEMNHFLIDKGADFYLFMENFSTTMNPDFENLKQYYDTKKLHDSLQEKIPNDNKKLSKKIKI